MSDARGLNGLTGQSIASPRLPTQRLQDFLRSPSYATRTTLYGSYLNVLLIFVPIGIVAGALGWPEVAVFFLNFLALIPLAPLISFSTGQLSASLGQVFGGLLNIALSNSVEMIIGIIAVSRGQILIVQTSLIGNILFESLLILGSSFFFASFGKENVKFNKTLTNIMSSLMMVTAVSLLVPTAMSPALLSPDALHAYTNSDTDSDVLVLSRSTAIILLILFAIYLFFQLKTHAFLFFDSSDNGSPRDNGSITNEERDDYDVAEEEQGPTLSPWTAICVQIITIFCVIWCASYLVNSINGLSKALNIGKTFIGLVLIPTICNTAKFATIVAASMRNKIDFTVRAVIGSVLQVALFIAPLLVLLGWILNQPMILSFDVFEAAVFLLAIMVMNYIIQDGKTNYFEGFMMMGTYIIIVAAFFIRPDPAE